MRFEWHSMTPWGCPLLALGQSGGTVQPGFVAVAEVAGALAFRGFWPVAKAEDGLAERVGGRDAGLAEEALQVPEEAVRQLRRPFQLSPELLAAGVEQAVVGQEEAAAEEGELVGGVGEDVGVLTEITQLQVGEVDRELGGE